MLVRLGAAVHSAACSAAPPLRCAPPCSVATRSNCPAPRRAALICASASGDQAAPAPPDDAGPSTSGRAEADDQSAAAAATCGLAPALLRRAASAADAAEVLDLLSEEPATLDYCLTEQDCQALMEMALQRANPELAQSIFQAMTAAAAGTVAPLMSSGSDLGGGEPTLAWPPASTATACSLVIGLCRALRTREAVALIASVRSRGLPTSDDVQFGHVVDCPRGSEAGPPLAVVQPQEGVKAVADAVSRYEYELYSGSVVSVASDSLVAQGSWLAEAARRAGLLKRPRAGAVHTLAVQTPAGQQRTFRCATATADVPAKGGDRVTLVCSPQTAVFSRSRLFSAAPPGSKPGEALSLSNHSTRSATQLLRPPGADAGGLPQWAVPAAVLLTASDAATSLIDPALPYLVAAAAAAAVAAGVAGMSVVLPRLKQLPERVVEVQGVRQQLLARHSALDRRVRELVQESEEDVRVLARLWQLQAKMGAVAAGGAYDARLERVVGARASIEQRLSKRVEMIDAYARVISMIEIEVEMDTEVPAAEVVGIEQQIVRLGEIEDLQEEWQLQAEAQDEVERLLRSI